MPPPQFHPTRKTAMNNPDSTNPDSSASADWQQHFAEVRRQVNLMLLAMAVGSLILMAFLFLNAWRAATDLNTIRQQFSQIDALSRNQASAVQALDARLAEYGRTHPDFAPIMQKYRIGQTNRPPTNTTAPKSVTPPPALKK